MASQGRVIPGVPARRFALTYDIPPQFGGLTKAMLTRTFEMTRRQDEPCVVLTVGPQTDLHSIRDDLVRRGLLVDRSHLRNMWEDFADDRWFDSLPVDAAEPAPDEVDPSRDVVVRRTDGSLLAIQRWARIGTRSPVAPTGDAVTDTWLWGQDGSYIGHVAGTWSLWRHWLAALTAEFDGTPVDVIIDSATVADAVAGLDAPHARLAVVIHNNHLRLGATPPVASLNRWRAHLLRRAAQFDLVVFLTEQQRHDAELVLGPLDHAVTVPNVGPDPDPKARRRRPRRGLMLAALTPRKRVDHAIRAIGRLSDQDVTLTVHGEGARREALEALILDLEAPVDLPGYTTDAREVLRTSSFLLLTSSGEGLPMVLLEAMSTGCIPIAYDIAYGPSDVITDGVDGFLVSPGTDTALATAIEQLTSRSRWKLTAMRRAALRRSRDFAAEAVTTRWDEVLSGAGPRMVSEPTADDERLAAVTRFLSPELLVRVDSAAHGTDDFVDLRLQVDLAVDGRPDLLAHPVSELRFESVRRAHTGKDPRTVLEHSVEGSCFIVRCPVDALAEATLFVTGTALGVPVTGLVVGTTGPAPWQSFVPDRSSGAVLVVDRAVGLTAATATPKAVGTVRRSDRGLDVHVDPGADHLELRCGDQTFIVDADQQSTFVIGSDLPPGRWRVRACRDDKLSEVAMIGSVVDNTALDPSHSTWVDLTPKGYLRVESRRGAVFVDNLVADGSSWILSGTATRPAVLKLSTQSFEIGAGAWSIEVTPDLTGAVRAGPGVTVLATPHLTSQWPVIADTLVLHRRGPQAEPALTRVDRGTYGSTILDDSM